MSGAADEAATVLSSLSSSSSPSSASSTLRVAFASLGSYPALSAFKKPALCPKPKVFSKRFVPSGTSDLLTAFCFELRRAERKPLSDAEREELADFVWLTGAFADRAWDLDDLLDALADQLETQVACAAALSREGRAETCPWDRGDYNIQAALWIADELDSLPKTYFP